MKDRCHPISPFTSQPPPQYEHAAQEVASFGSAHIPGNTNKALVILPTCVVTVRFLQRIIQGYQLLPMTQQSIQQRYSKLQVTGEFIPDIQGFPKGQVPIDKLGPIPPPLPPQALPGSAWLLQGLSRPFLSSLNFSNAGEGRLEAQSQAPASGSSLQIENGFRNSGLVEHGLSSTFQH